MSRVVVVGAGIAGSSVARAARAAGMTATVVADGKEHSRAAAALLRSAYHAKHPGEPGLFARSVALYREWGVPLAAGAWVTNYRTPSRDQRYDDDWLLLDPAAPLVAPDSRGTATATATGVVVGDRRFDADAVVWCTGAATGTGITYGVTWVHNDPAALTAPELLRIHHFAPYKTIAAGVAGGQARLGSSSANTEAKATQQAQMMLTAAVDFSIVRTSVGWNPIFGQRCKTGLYRRSGIHYSLGSLHRTGYALAPALGEQLVAEIFASGVG